ncbi:DUF4124 domain-containing protein [Arhodomonas sp. AD133]|uniref:DUF4124 domain-containing protein n=1 Tax=Arhodomonas sp. AD133 TaxID=3415009 RepID=UPI003EBF3707
MLRTAIFLAVLALATTPLQAAKTYKWTDADGKVHYGSQPPQDADARELRVPGAGSGDDASSAGDSDRTAADDEQQESGKDKDSEDDERGTPDPEWMAKQCESAQKNLRIFTDATPNQRFRRPDGTVVRYTEEEIAAEREEARKFVDQYCKDGDNTGG